MGYCDVASIYEVSYILCNFFKKIYLIKNDCIPDICLAYISEILGVFMEI